MFSAIGDHITGNVSKVELYDVVSTVSQSVAKMAIRAKNANDGGNFETLMIDRYIAEQLAPYRFNR